MKIFLINLRLDHVGRKLPALFLIVFFLCAGAYLLRNTALANIVLNAYLDQRLTSGLVGYWSFESHDINWTTNKIVDRSGNGNTGTFVNIATTTAQALGKIGQAIAFDGVNDYIDAGTGSSLDITGNITISFWANVSSIQSYEAIVDKVNGATGYSVWMNSGAGPNDFYFTVNGYGSGASSGNAIVANEWAFWTVTYDGANINWYKNNVLLTTTPFGTNPSSSSNSFLISNHRGGGTPYLVGALDELRIYNRALTADERTRLYNMGASFKQNVSHRDQLTSGLVGYWTFDGKDMDISSSTKEIYDVSGQGNHGDWKNHATTTVIGKVGQAVDFDGTDDTVSINSFSSTAKTYTFAFWVKRQDLDYIFDTGSDRLVIAMSGSGPTSGALSFYDGSWKSIGSLVPTNEWHHAVLVLDNSTLVATGYLDGVNIGTAVYAGNKNLGQSGSTAIGSYNSANIAPFFKGALDDFRIYNRALSADEVKRLYNMGASFKQNVSKRDQLTSGLVGYWSFDGRDIDWTKNKAYDRSGQGNDGVFTNMATATAPVIGKVGQGILFDGNNDYLYLPSSLSGLSGTNDTFSAWIKLSAYDTYGCVVAGTDTTNNLAWQIYPGGTFVYFSDSAGVTIPATPFDDGQWWHFVATYDGATARVYVNGIEAGNNAISRAAFAAGAKNFAIGDWVGSPGVAWRCNGSIDDVRIYNRTLNADEVMRLYNMGR